MTRAKTTPRFRKTGLIGLLVLAALLGPLGREWASAGPSPMTIAVTDSADPVASGEQLTYTIVVMNTGGAAVNNVMLSNQLNGLGGIGTPPMYQITSSPTKVCTQSSNLVTCAGGEMPGFSSWTITVRGIVTAPNGTVINNTAQVTATKSAQTFTDAATEYTDVANDEPPPLLPDLSINKTGPTSVAPSSAMSYILTVYNNGTVNATNVRVADTLPAGLAGVSVSSTSLFVCSYVAPTVTCDGGAITAGGNATITINATSPAVDGQITNTASVDPNNTIVESNELNNVSATVNTSVSALPPPPENHLTITKTGPAIAVPGQLVTYVIVVTNPSPFRSDYNTVVDGTQGLEATSIVATQAVVGGTIGNNGYGCTVLAAQVSCSIFKLESGGTWTIAYSGTVIASAGSTILNTATVNGNIKNVGISATTTFQTTVQPDVDLSITKADQPDPVCARSWPLAPFGGPAYPPIPPLVAPPVCLGGLEYTFVVGNSGINDATDVVLRDPLPAGTVFDSYEDTSGAGFTCALDPGDPVPNTVICSGGTIPAASTRTVKLLVVAPPAIGSITNTVYVDPYNAIFEADELNNSFTINTNVVTGIDLVIVKYDEPPGAGDGIHVVTDGFDPIATSGTQTYTIFVDNVGPQDATNIKVRDILPADTIFLETEETNGFTCTYLIGPHVVECTGGSLLGTAAEFYPPFGAPGDDLATIKIRVFAQPYVGTMLNEVRVDPFNEIPEINEANNIDFESTEVITGDATIGAFNELSITKCDHSSEAPCLTNTDPIATSGVIIYRVQVTNSGTDPAFNITMRDFLPAGTTFISAVDVTGGPDSFLCAHAAGVVNCTGATLSGTINAVPGIGTSRTVEIQAFAPAAPAVITNIALVDPDNQVPEGNEGNNQAQETTTVQVAGPTPFIDLAIGKAASPTATPGGPITYILTPNNVGSNPAFQVKVRDVLPAGTTFVSATDTTGGAGSFVCSHAGGIVDCVGGTLDGSLGLAGVPTLRTIQIIVTAPQQTGVTLTNQAFIDPFSEIAEGSEINNFASDTTLVQSQINLKTTKLGPQESAPQGSIQNYEIKVKNEGTMPAFGVKVVDPMPVGMIILTVDPGTNTNFACEVFENPVNFIECIGDLDADEEVSIKIRTFITADSGRLDNEACADPDDVIVEYDPPGNTDNCSTVFLIATPPAPDIKLTKTAEFDPAPIGTDQVYHILVENIGSATANGVTITDVLPFGLTFVSAVDASATFTCMEAGGIVTCTGDVAPSGSHTIDITATVTTPDAVTNTAVADPAVTTDPGAINEVNFGNNVSSVTSGTVGPDLEALSLTDAPDPVAKGDQLIYTAHIANTGSQDAAAVLIRQTFAASPGTIISAVASQGFACDPNLPADFADLTIECTGNLAVGESTILTIVFMTDAGSPNAVTTTVTVDPLNTITEMDEGNNTLDQTTTLSGAICTSCIDLVLGDVLEAPDDPVVSGTEVTFVVTVGNIGDTTTDDGNNSNGYAGAGDDVLIFFDIVSAGNTTLSGVSITSSNPNITCDLVSSGATSALHDCHGQLGPGEGVILTITATANDDGSVTVDAEADPTGFLSEFNEGNNGPSFATITVNDP